MTRAEAIAKLEVLLQRVRSRAGERLALRPAASGSGAMSTSARAAAAPAPAAPSRGAAGPVAAAPPPASATRESHRHAPEAPPPPAPVEARDAPPSDGFDSRERLVAAAPVMPDAEPSPEALEAAPVAADGAAARFPSSPPLDVGEAEIEVVAEDEDEQAASFDPVALEGDASEEPPASSKRPLVAEPEERLAQMAFGAEEPAPIHTPPPESGRLPSAPAEFDPDVTGVRHATPLTPKRPAEAAAHPELVAQVARPALAESDAVADVVAAAQRFAPATFVELLDASLRL